MALDDRYRMQPVYTDGETRFTRLRPVPRRPRAPDAIAHILTEGETLESLAAMYYGRSRLWWRIADANPGRDFAYDWRPGDMIVIPPPREALRITRRRND